MVNEKCSICHALLSKYVMFRCGNRFVIKLHFVQSEAPLIMMTLS